MSFEGDPKASEGKVYFLVSVSKLVTYDRVSNKDLVSKANSIKNDTK